MFYFYLRPKVRLFEGVWESYFTYFSGPDMRNTLKGRLGGFKMGSRVEGSGFRVRSLRLEGLNPESASLPDIVPPRILPTVRYVLRTLRHTTLHLQKEEFIDILQMRKPSNTVPQASRKARSPKPSPLNL